MVHTARLLDDDWRSKVAQMGRGIDVGMYARRLPQYAIPEEEMPPEAAYSLIQDELLIGDVTPALNLGSFVTTQMENKAERLIIDTLSKNIVNHDAYPATTEIHNRCVNILARLFHAPPSSSPLPTTTTPSQDREEAIGTSTVGSSEAILLAVLAMKKRWASKRKAAGKDYSRPNIIMSSAVQVCWKKATRYFDVEERYVYCSKNRYTIDPGEAVELVDEHTIGICAILGTTYTGEYEDVEGLNGLLVERGLDVPIHVDAASGGFVAPFIHPEVVWDFRLENVVSINTSGHKFGFVFAGIGWLIWRGADYLPHDLIFSMNYLGAPQQSSFTLNFSRGASHVVSQYFKLVSLGRKGYTRVLLELVRMAEYLASKLQGMGCFVLLSPQPLGRRQLGLPLVAFRLCSYDAGFDEFAISYELRRQGGWVVPAYTMAPHAEEVKLLRVVVREDLTLALCDKLVADFCVVLQRLNKRASRSVGQGTDDAWDRKFAE